MAVTDGDVLRRARAAIERQILRLNAWDMRERRSSEWVPGSVWPPDGALMRQGALQVAEIWLLWGFFHEATGEDGPRAIALLARYLAGNHGLDAAAASRIVETEAASFAGTDNYFFDMLVADGRRMHHEGDECLIVAALTLARMNVDPLWPA
jgi:hypothetical protein